MKYALRPYVIAILLLVAGASGAATQSACAKAPPNLNPQATHAWYGTKVIKSLDVLRDIAQDGAATSPTPVISVATARAVTKYHESAIKIVHDGAVGWQSGVQSGLTELLKDLPSSEKQQLAAYVGLLQTVLKEVLQ